MLTVTTSYRTSAVIDGQAVKLAIKKLSVGEWAEFVRRFDHISTPETLRRVATRKAGEEMEKRPVPRARTEAEIAAAEALDAFDQARLAGQGPVAGPEAIAVLVACRALIPPEPTGEAFVVSAAEIKQRRLAEMTPQERAAFDDLDRAEDEAASAFLVDAITRYASVLPGEIEQTDPDTGDTTPVLTGAELVTAFSSRNDVLMDIAQLIRMENSFGESSKKTLRSLFGSLASSGAPAKDPAGSAPAPIAAVAEPRDFASSADAMAGSVIG